jgi:O-antigen ligase
MAKEIPAEGALRAVAVAACGALLAAAAAAVLAPPLFWLLLGCIAAAGAGYLVFRHTVPCCAIWMVVAGSTPEMVLGDLLGPDAFQPIIAVVKAAQFGLVLVCIMRFGPRADPFNPGFVFVAMAMIGFAHGLHPGMTPLDSLRSLAGSVAPFAFSFSVLSLDWARAIILTARWIPILTVAAGAVLDVAGIRPLFSDLGGARLAALGHPAFLGGFCLTAMYACLIELFRDGRRRDAALLAANMVLLAMTGARAPLAYGLVVCVASLLFVTAPRFPWRRRVTLLLAGAVMVPVLAALAGELVGLRLFFVLSSAADSLSGRDVLWPLFEAAAAQSPWVGWGVGAGNAIIAPDSDVGRLIGAIAAHNEYLRMRVEGGWIGLAVLILGFAAWVWTHTARLRRSDRMVMRMVFVAFALHAFTDNVLISTSACVLFTFVSAVFARGMLESAETDDGSRELA